MSIDNVSKLKEWYKYYHRLCTCYKWKYKKFKRARLSPNMASALLVVSGGIAGGATANPNALGCISGPGILIQGYIKNSGINNKLVMCRFAYTTYKKVLTQIRSYQRGLSYDEKAFLDEVRDDIVTDLCPTVSSMSSEYDKKYGNI